MKSTPYILGIVILIILAVAIGLAFNNDQVEVGNTNPNATSTTATSTSNVNNPLSDLIRVTTPVPNQTIASGFELRGEARGNWFFEASAPAKIIDANGKLVAQFIITADSDWMTTNFVPFSEIVNFSTPETPTGSLILEKDNPSGLPEYDRSLTIPIKFATSSSDMMSVKAYFSNSGLAGSQNTDCSRVFAVTRSVPKTSTTGKAALEELLKGPNVLEGNGGYTTNLNPGVVLNSLTVTNGVARADFNAALDSGVAGSCRVGAIRAQIEQTLKQFASVKQVVISVNGETEEILQP